MWGKTTDIESSVNDGIVVAKKEKNGVYNSVRTVVQYNRGVAYVSDVDVHVLAHQMAVVACV